MGLALACLAPSAVSNALVLWGDEAQQSTYLPAFVGEHAPVAALAIHEPQPLFDPFALQTIARRVDRSEEHTSELQSLMRISYAVLCLQKKTNTIIQPSNTN